MARNKKPVTQVSSHSRRNPAAKKMQANNPDQCAMPLDSLQASNVLSAAGSHITHRSEAYDKLGQGERSFAHAARIYNAIQGTRNKRELSPADVAKVLECVKEARLQSSLDAGVLHFDSVVDKAAYTALWAEELDLAITRGELG